MKNSFLEAFGKFCAVITLGFFGAILNGYCFCIMWRWFIVGTFNAPVLRIPIAIGIFYVVHFVVSDFSNKKANSEDFWPNLIGSAVFKGPLFLFFAWIVHLFI